VPDGVCVIWAGRLEESFDVVCRRPRLTLVTAHGTCDAPHARAACFPIIVIVLVGRGHDPLGALHAPLLATLSALLGTVDCHVE
jgi:hypothetical protein